MVEFEQLKMSKNVLVRVVNHTQLVSKLQNKSEDNAFILHIDF